MAFINDYTTEEEKRLLASFKDDPKTTLAKDFDKNPFNYRGWVTYWTVDRERKIALLNFGIRDRENPCEGEEFVFLYKKYDRDHAVRLLMRHGLCYNEDSLRQALKYGVKVIKIWDIKEMDKPTMVTCGNEGFFDALSECLSIYDIDGRPNQDIDPKRCKAFVKYNGKIHGV